MHPNVLLVVIGGARADRLSCYGHSRQTTPCLDRVAADGVRFEAMIATAPSAIAAQAALFTGCFSSQHGAHEESARLAPTHRTLAEWLLAAGYRTAAFCSNPAISPETGFERGFEVFATQRRQSRIAERAWSYGRRASDRLLRRQDAGARRTTEALKEWLANSPQPFFAFVEYDEARLPLHPLSPLEMAFAGAADALRLRNIDQSGKPPVAGAAPIDVDDAEVIGRAYDSALHYIDARIAEIIELLERGGAWANTLLVVVGDHGEALGEGGAVGSAAGLKDSLLRVPLLIRCADSVPSGVVTGELAQSVDIAPTILHLATGEAMPAEISGQVLLGDRQLSGGADYAIAERYRPAPRAVRKDRDAVVTEVRMKAIRTKNEKFVWRSDEANELYDLRSDPGEHHNRIAADLPRADQLRRQLFDWFARIDSAAA